MARRPEGNPAIAHLKRSVFSQLAGRLAQHDGPTYPLHVGDSYLAPPPGAHLADQTETARPGIHRYEHPKGNSELIEAVVDAYARAPKHLAIEPDQVLVTTGCTGGLSAAVQALLAPGQKLMVATPAWPLIRGMATASGVGVVQVPFYDRVATGDEARRRLEAAVDPAVAAVYVNSPNNPSGLVATRDVVSAVVEFAGAHDLWILSDEVYEHLSFGSPPTTLASLPGAAERTIAVHSLSKAFAMAGNRVGYVVGPPDAIARLEQLTTYVVYSVNTGGQRAAAQALRNGWDWLDETRQGYAEVGRAAAQRLGVAPPEGGTFLFLDIAEHLGADGMLGFLERCLERGLLLAPGQVFGADYATCVRVCFTSVEPARTMEGIEILAELLGR